MALSWPAPRPLPWSPPQARIPSLPPALRRFGSGSRIARIGRRRWRDLAAHAVLAGAALILLHRAIVTGAIQWQDDTRYFYYPLLATVADALRHGRLPLWEPGVFGGYPLFADGESGMLYPLHLVALRFLDTGAALVALRLVRFYLAGAFTYAYVRTTGVGRTGALIAGLAFMLSGFMVAQIVHENLDSGMIWLPLVLAFLERGLRTPWPGRLLPAIFAGVALAMQALAVHVQVCVFTAATVSLYGVWRVLVGDTGRRYLAQLPRRVLDGVGLGLVAGLVAAGLSAVQVLPLLEIAARSARGSGISAEAATINSVTPFRLLTVLFPHLLTRPDGSSVGYWVYWEVTVYVGVPTLLLAILAIALRHDRYVLFFAVLAGLSLALSTGRYGPEWVQLATQALLGDHGLRSPGRFAFLWSFGVAVLAGWGMDWPDRRAGKNVAGAPARWWTGWWPVVASLTLAALAGGLLLAVGAAHRWLVAHPDLALTWLERRYLAFDPQVGLSVTADEVYRHLLVVLDHRYPPTTVWGGAVVAGAGLLMLWTLSPRRRLAARVLTVVAVALPLLFAGLRSHPATPVAALEPRSSAVRYLQSRLAPLGWNPDARPLFRVYTSQPVYLDQFDVEPNALLPLGIQEAGGYSSLSSHGSLAYAWAAEITQGRLLDVWNTRYFLWPTRDNALPSHELTAFHPQRPLVCGTGTNAGAAAAFRVPDVLAENVRLVATLRDAWAVPPGTIVAWVGAVDDAGEAIRWPLRMGFELADATAPGVPPATPTTPATPASPGPRPQTVFSWEEPGPGGKLAQARLYYVKLPLDHPRRITRLTVRPVPLSLPEEPILRVYGLGVGLPDWTVHNVTWFDRERFTPAFDGRNVRVYRNERVLPRAFLLPLAVRLPVEAHLKTMAERAFDPERMLLVAAPPAGGTGAGGLEGPVEEPNAGSWFTAPADPAGPPPPPIVRVEDELGRVASAPAGRSTITRYEADRVVVEVEAKRPAWLFLADTFDPDWQAYVDGARRPIRLANAAFRAVAVPAGRHVVEFRYAPRAVQWGAGVTLVTGIAVLAIVCAGLPGAVRRAGRQERARRA